MPQHLSRLVVVPLIVVLGCREVEPQSRDDKSAKPVAVIQGETLAIQPKTWPKQVRVQGSLFADDTVAVSSKVAGRVVAVHVDLGDSIEVGKPVVELDDSEYRYLVAQSEAQLQQARSAVGLREGDSLEKLNPDNAAPVREARAILDEAQQAIRRIQQLAEQNAISATDVETAEAAERVAAARLTSAQNSVREKLALIAAQTSQLSIVRQNLVDTKILAPFSGQIQNRTVAIGAYVQPGQSLMTLMRVNPIRFRSAVPERYAHLLKVGQEVRIVFDLSGQIATATVARISPALDPLNRSLAFEAILPNDQGSYRSGLFGEADVILDPQATAIVIPTRSLIRFAGVDKVWKVSGGMLREQVVAIGRTEGDMCEIVEGLSANDVVLLDGESGRIGRLETK